MALVKATAFADQKNDLRESRFDRVRQFGPLARPDPFENQNIVEHEYGSAIQADGYVARAGLRVPATGV